MDYYTGKNYGPGNQAYTAVMPKEGFQYKYGEDGTRYSVPIEGYTGQPPNQLPGFRPEERSLIQPVTPPTDQEIRDEGLKFMPQQKYLQKPFEFPTKEIEEKGITNTDAFTNSGNDGFDVYNSNPDSISNRDYNPYRYQEATDKNFTRPEKSKFQEMLSKSINFIPGANIAKKGLDALGGLLPINRRAIMENELAGQGIMVNDIGQIVSDGGNINEADGSNIMAGYNASKVDKDTFKKRRLMIEQKMKDPKQKAAKLKALNAAEEKMLGTATDRTNIIYADDEEEKEKKKKVDFLSRFFKKKKTADTTGTDNKTGTTTGTTTDNTGTTDTTQYANPGDNQSVSSSGLSYDQGGGKTGSYDEAALAKGGRAGYFFGGRAGYAEGGAIYSRLGTLSSGVQSAEQQLQGINASLQKAESDLGSDSPGGGSSLAGGPSFTSNFEDANNQGPGSNLLFGGSSDGTNPFPGLVGDNTLNNTTTPFGSLYGGGSGGTINNTMAPREPGQPEPGPVSSIGDEFRAGVKPNFYGNADMPFELGSPLNTATPIGTAQEEYAKIQEGKNRPQKDLRYGENMSFEEFKAEYDAGKTPMQSPNQGIQTLQPTGPFQGGFGGEDKKLIPKGGMNFTLGSYDPMGSRKENAGYIGQLPGFSDNYTSLDPNINKGIGSIL